MNISSKVIFLQFEALQTQKKRGYSDLKYTASGHRCMLLLHKNTETQAANTAFSQICKNLEVKSTITFSDF